MQHSAETRGTRDESTGANPPVAMVTGAAAGIGLASVRRLLADGFVVGALDLSETIAETLSSEIASGRVIAVSGDVSAPSVRARLVDETTAAFGGIDVLVNNAGTGGFGERIERLDLDHLRKTLEINSVAVAAFVQLVLPQLKQSQRARVINIGSLFADDPVEGGLDYTMSKGAIHSLTRVLAVELGPDGITCNSIAPGFILTDMHREEVELQAKRLGVDVEERFAQLRAQVPLRRHGTADDVAGAVGWLASLDSAYVSGVRIAVNGGVSFV